MICAKRPSGQLGCASNSTRCVENAKAENDPRVMAAKRMGGWVVDAFSGEFISPSASRDEIAAKAEATLADFREKLAEADWQVLLYRGVYSEELPEGKVPEHVCDIELRFAFSFAG